ncbi:MAG TPA: endonuclease III [Candidatus Nanoarchaeia archaeon]|nr:endonuclease III [Candidatus Nanoarchaeia archaeon]
MKNQETIKKELKTIKEFCKDFQNPIVTEIGDQTGNPFKVLISCVLSLRTRDEITGRVAKELFKVADTPEKILKLKLEELEKIIHSINFYKTKARNIQDISKVLIEKYNGKVPNNFNKLINLKGIGVKTAAVTMVYGFRNKEFIPTDIHVHTIANRLNWVKTKKADETMYSLMKIIPKDYWIEINDLLVKFGQNICITSSPLCSKCPLDKVCPKIGVKRSR